MIFYPLKDIIIEIKTPIINIKKRYTLHSYSIIKREDQYGYPRKSLRSKK